MSEVHDLCLPDFTFHCHRQTPTLTPIYVFFSTHNMPKNGVKDFKTHFNEVVSKRVYKTFFFLIGDKLDVITKLRDLDIKSLLEVVNIAWTTRATL